MMFVSFDVKGDAIEASASDKLKPISATFNAAQSFAPSPHIPTTYLVWAWRCSTRTAFPSGLIQANIFAFSITEWKVA